jgi:hypothetical protein
MPNIQLVGEINTDGCREEIAWIKYFKDEGVNLVNGTDGGEKGFKLSEDARKRIVLSKMGNTFWKGKKHKTETKLKIALWHIGKPRSEITKRKLSLAHTGKKLSAIHKQKISLGGKGRKLTEKQKKKQTDCLVNYWRNRRNKK